VAGELLPAIQNNFCAIVVLLNFSANLDDFACELADVTDVLHIVREDHNRKRTEAVVFTEVEIVGFAACLHADDLAGYAVSFSNVLGGLVERNAVGAEGGSGK